MKKKRVVVITGASKGIGKSIALRLQDKNTLVINLDIDIKNGKELEQNNNIFFIYTDVTNYESLLNARKYIINRFGRVSILIINAGISKKATIDEISIQDWNDVIAVNLTGSFLTIKAFYSEFVGEKHNDKNIIFITSGSAITGSGGGIHYSASKGAQFSMIRACARELGKYGVNVNGIAPRVIRTEIFDYLYPTEIEKNQLLEKIPIGRFGKAEDVANITFFLCSEASSYIHGQIILADGGRTYY